MVLEHRAVAIGAACAAGGFAAHVVVGLRGWVGQCRAIVATAIECSGDAARILHGLLVGVVVVVVGFRLVALLACLDGLIQLGVRIAERA